VLCRLDEINDPGSIARTVDMAGGSGELLLVRQGARVFAYRNACPHTGAPLDWVPGRFLSLDRKHIQCATHDALFRIADGLCVSGPCPGARLAAVPLMVRAGEVLLPDGV
jgi:nitrite reductase/ring-hydroxylating ferredoxin subunit